MKHQKAKNVALFGMMVALAFTFSYLESLLPFNFGIPGVKLGLANIVVVIALYHSGVKTALPIALIRILLAAFTFGNTFSLLYSLAGGLLSFTVMAFLQRTKLSVVGVSLLGGVSHNIGQLVVAACVLGTARIVYYLPVLLVAGAVTGLLLGIAAKAVLARLKRIEIDN